MQIFKKTLTVFMSIIPIFSAKSNDTLSTTIDVLDTHNSDPVNLRPLNNDADNMYAAHRSHSSHGSHRSSSGGGYSVPAPSRNQPTAPGRSATVSPRTRQPRSTLSSDQLTIQIMRVQIALTSNQYFTGSIDGILGGDTRNAIELFQKRNGLTVNGKMTTETLNALGVPASR